MRTIRIFVVDDKKVYFSAGRLMSKLGLSEKPDIWKPGESVIIDGHKIVAFDYDVDTDW